MNRYTNLSTSSFNPLSTQEIMMVPMYKQQQHLQQQAAVDAMGINLNRLDVDDLYYQENVNKIKFQQDKYTDELMNKGTSRGLTRNLMNLSRERRDFLEGDGAKIESQYKAYQANAEELKKMYQSGKISSQKYQLGLQQALGKYNQSGGVQQGGAYSSFAATQDTDYYERAEKTAIAISKNPKKIEQLAGLQLTPDGSMYIDIETDREYTPQDAIKLGVMNALYSDQGIMSDLNQRQELGMLGNQTANSLVQGIAQNLDTVFSVDNKTIDRSLVGNKGFKHSDDEVRVLGQGTYNYTPSPTRYTKQQENNHLDITKKILSGDKKTNIPTSSTTQYGISTGTANTTGGDPYTINDLPNDVKDRYSEIAKGLQRKGLIKNNDITDPTVLREIVKYQETFGTRDNSIAIINDASGGVGKYSTGLKSKDNVSILKGVQNTKHRATYMHPETGKTYSWEQLQSEFGVTDITAVEGFVDADNDLGKTVSGKNSNMKSEWVSPQVVTLKGKDDIELAGFFKTRDDSEQMSPRYQADVRLSKNIFTKTKDNPLLPQDVTIGGKDMEATYLPEEQALNILSDMQSRLYDDEGKILPGADSVEVEMFQNLMETKNRAGKRAGIYEFINKDGKIMYNDKKSIQEIEYLLSGVTNY